jgi:hypothetical protein
MLSKIMHSERRKHKKHFTAILNEPIPSPNII